jgi:phosphoribosylglycinamide formyltransferase 1
MSGRKRVAILISGRGSNMANLIKAAKAPNYPAEISLVISNKPDATGLNIAQSAGVRTFVIDHMAQSSREGFDAALHEKLIGERIELVACAGFMRIMSAGFVEKWRDKMINIHPSLLPSYKGLNTHARALADGVKIHGCSVHFLRHEVDAGPIIAQAAVAVEERDDADTLAARVLAAEHLLYPHALALVASGRARVEGEHVVIDGKTIHASPLIVPPIG